MGGFILGLDGDDERVFGSQIQFIQEAGIPMALVGLLTALKGTDLYQRMQSEGRLVEVPVGTSTTALNFVPQMDPQKLIEGYLRVNSAVYDPTLENYFERCLTLFKHLKPLPHVSSVPARARSLSGADDGARAPLPQPDPGLRQVHREGHQGPSVHARGGDPPGGARLSLREVHPPSAGVPGRSRTSWTPS